jgi:hypothetical protein
MEGLKTPKAAKLIAVQKIGIKSAPHATGFGTRGSMGISTP